jgi:uncharacterized membrane protein YeaQ/YmgE (transglycosylase-associated protein family)
MDAVWTFFQANPGLLAFLVIGLIGGWIAGLLLGGGGLLRNLFVGVIGAFIGGYITNYFGFSFGFQPPIVNQIITATIGALAVTVIARVIAR